MTKKLLLCISIVFFTNILFASTPPTIFNFRIESSQPDRVYFDSDKPIKGSNIVGFTISNKSISGIIINEGQLSNHYITVSNKFTYWDNNTIRYEGGSDISDTNNNGLIEFTLSYINNNIPEPEANNDRYVTTSASGGGDGKSENSAWTLEEAFDKANAGITVWIKAGNYGNQNLSIYNDGTSVSPLKFIGYKNTPGDISKNYYDYGKKWSTSEMPTLTGKSASNGHAIQLRGINYVVFRNLQITNYQFGIRANNSHNSNLVFDRINGKTFGLDLNTGNDLNASFMALITYVNGSGDRPFTSNNKMKVLNCRSVNASMGGFTLFGEGSNLIKGTKSYNDRIGIHERQDYQISVNGHNNIITDCYIEQFNNTETSGSTHGIGIRGSSNLDNTYNLIEKSTAINFEECFYIRNYGCEYNVIKDVYAGNNGNSSYEDRGGIFIWGGSNYNIIERVFVENQDHALCFFDNTEEGNINNNDIGHDNIIRNSVFKNSKYAIRAWGTKASNLTNTFIYNNTFDNMDWFWRGSTSNVIVSGMNIINNQILNIDKSYVTSDSNFTGFTFQHNNFHNSWKIPSGVGNISVDPQLDNNLKPTLSSPKTITEGGLIIPEVKLDFEKKVRYNYNTIGAYQYSEDTTGYIEVNAGVDVEICEGNSTILTAIGEGTILWNTGETSNSISVSPEETTSYSVTITNGDNVGTDDVLVTVNGAPTVSLEEDKTICNGSEVTLTATGVGDFLWSTGETTESIIVSPTETTTYTVTASTACDTMVSDSIVINVNEKLNLNVGEDIGVCSGNEVTLTAQGNGSLLWSTGETTQSITVSPTETTTFYVTATLGDCSVTDEVIVSIVKNPEISLGDDKIICEGDEVTLYAQGSGIVLWNTGETTKSISVSPLVTTEYSVVSTINCGDTSVSVSDTIVVKVNEIVNLTTTEDMQICNGSDIVLTAESNSDVLWSTGETTSSITVSPSETQTYSVTAGNGICGKTEEIIITVIETASVSLGEDITICYDEEVSLTAYGNGDILWSTGETSATIKVNPLETTIYSVSATSACGDTVMDEIVINVNKELIVDAGDDKSICVGETVTLTANGNGNYLWSTGETTKIITVSPTKPDTYWVSNSEGDCSVSDEVFVDVQKAASVSLVEDFTICSGEEVTLIATGHGDYLWNTGATTSSISVQPMETTTYSISASSNACTADAVDEITIYVNESVMADAGNDVSIEPGDSYTLTASGGSSYLWSTGETTASIIVQPESTKVYSVEVGNGTSCSGTDEVKVSVEEIPLTINEGEDIIICKGDELILNARGSSNYLWNTGEVGTAITVNPNTTTTYTVSAQKNGNLETVDVVVTVEDCSSKRSVDYSIYPNPTDGLVNINIPSQKEGVELIVSAINGKIVFRSEVKSDKNGIFTQINLSHLSNGIYLVKMVSDSFNQTKKIILL
ncbi:T9SS type A sorting domain-containing protein [Aureibaculum sp. A20]|uniref:T9SS type A sorting domain-containing protein n=1 Tax=Aureibaculum flavum TaxID=2795986 RepID=A0ABS0WKY2_9FLAO|nr:T9SS type A sorting domain-containing protein [Aureibaculum flavum]MBJ2172631.1 T9SS type A sorting domain-containing protein [Aureibaculum flavum]